MPEAIDNMRSMSVNLTNFYQGRVPPHIKKASRGVIIFKTEDQRGKQQVKITPADVVKYYSKTTRNIVSDTMGIAGFYSQAEPIERIVEEALNWFKYINRSALILEADKCGLKLKI